MRRIWVFLCPCLALGISGCTAGTIGIALGIYSLSGNEHGGGAVNLAPLAPANIEHFRESGATVVIDYDLLDDDGGALTVAFSWWPADAPGEVFPATGRNGLRGEAGPAQVGGDGTQQVRVAPNELTRFRFRWNARKDLRNRLADPDSEGVSAARVVVRITSTEDGTGKAVFETESFVAGNDPPAILSLRADAKSGVIPLVISIADSTSDPVTLDARVVFTDEFGQQVSKPLTRKDTASIFLTAPDRGTEHTLFWESEKDFGYRRGPVAIEIVPKDIEEGPRISQEIEVDNNGDPQVQIVDVAGSSDKSFEIPIRFIVRDEEANPTSVILQWAAAEEGFEDLPFEASEYVLDPIFLRDLLTNPAAEFAALRRKLHILSEAPRVFRGVLDEADLSAAWIRETDFVRDGLVFCPPSQDGPRPLPGGIVRTEKEVFLIGQEVRFVAPSGPDGQDPRVIGSARIASFDPATSRATIADLAGAASAPPGTGYEIGARTGMHLLPSSGRGVLHTFLWDSVKDLAESEEKLGLNSRIKLRAMGIDTEVGLASFDSTFDLESGFVSRMQSLTLSPGSQEIAIRDVDEDGRNDLIVSVIPDLSRVIIHIFIQRTSGIFPHLPTHIIEMPAEGWVASFDFGIGDVDGDGRDDIVTVLSTMAGPTVVSTHRREVQATGGSAFALSLQFPSAMRKVSSVSVADAIGDRGVDLVLASADPREVRIFRNGDGALQETPEVRLSLNSTPSSLVVGDVDRDGRNDIVVGASDPLGIDRILAFLHRDGDTFERREAPTGGGGGPSVAIGGVAGDGTRMILVGSRDAEDVVIFSSHLAPIRTLRTGMRPISIASGEFDGDGVDDIAVAHSNGTVSVYLEGGDPSLPERAKFDLWLGGGVSSEAVVAGDVNNDGADDLVVLATEGLSRIASIHEQSGPGRLIFGRPRVAEAGRTPMSLAIGDVNGDGRNDVVLANAGSSSISIFWQDLFGALPARATQTIETDPIGITRLDGGAEIIDIGDLDGDGRNDVAVANFEAKRVSVYAEREDSGEFKPGPTFVLPGADRPRALAIGDVTGDGRNELIVACSGSDRLTVYRFESVGAQGTMIWECCPGEGPNAIGIGDLNGDGRTDFIATAERSQHARVIYQGASGHLEEGLTLRFPGGTPRGVKVGDLNSDGRDDVLVLLSGPFAAWIYYQGQDGSLPAVPSKRLKVSTNPQAAAIGDVNGDGRSDVVISTIEERCSVFYQNPSRDLGACPDESRPCLADDRNANQRPDLLESMYDVGLGDVSGDGRSDLVGVLTSSDGVVVYLAR